MSEIQTELDRAYSPSVWSHRTTDPDEVIKLHVETLTEGTEIAKRTIPCFLNWAVDSEALKPDYAIDIYFPSDTNSIILNLDTLKPKKMFVYIHGGYWQFLSRRESAFMAQTMSDEHILTAVVGYPIAPHASMDEIVVCVERALVKLLQWAAKLSIKVCVAGHSAGAHLASMLLLVDWKTKYNIDPCIFGGFFLISGVFDLVPLVSTYINKPIKMNIDLAKHLSPLHRNDHQTNTPLKDVCILCVHAQHDPPAFHEQNRNYADFLKQLGFQNVQMLQIDGYDHFDIIEQLENRDQPLTALILSLMKK